MPKRKRTRKRTTKRKRFRASRKARVPKSGMLGFKHLQRLKYVERIQIDPGVSLVSNYVYSANGLYDPNITGTGHQPMGFDQMMLFYDHYRVVGSKIKCTFMSTSTAVDPDQKTYICGVDLKDDATTTTDFQDIMEQGTSNYKICTNAEASQKAILHKGFSPKRFFSTKGVGDKYQGVINANPTEQAYFHVFIASPDTAVNGAACHILVEIDFVAVFTEPKTLVGS